MTWNPLKRNHLTQRPSPAPPLLSHAEDRDLDVTVQKLIHAEDTIRKLTKEMKKYLEAVANLDRADQRLSMNLSTSGLAHLSDEFRRIVEDYHSVTTQVGKTVQEMIHLCQKTFIEPLKKLRDEFALIAAAITKREELVNNWKYLHNRVRKLQEKKDRAASHIAKLERERRAEEVAGKELRTVHAQLLVELPAFLDKRLEYIKPSVHALIMIQLDYYGNTTRLFTHLMPVQNSSDSPGSAMMSETNYQHLIAGYMNEIRALTIVKDN
ncbi:bridging integrator 3 homolog [Neodiprion pinetum]|uniref:bridging integrator 3 homolog n=1 Tax=Neodiprion pinetum TaxID=441929 RepID=UPI001EE066FB|nr:bridging integrator 3-like isoform X1 [Neodiprion pinetum]XP_046491875.1 bridging integrator 3-like isoform X1 [Neodiprion pinetum]XP_046491924.1 bridging integrator 3-like isoform X1 [Neodiprion pinetum]